MSVWSLLNKLKQSESRRMPTAFLMLLQAWVNIEQNFSANIIAFSFMCLLWGGKILQFCVIVLVSVRVLEMESNFVAQVGLRLLCSSFLLCICTIETTGTRHCAWLTYLKSIYLFLFLCVCLWTMCLLNVQKKVWDALESGLQMVVSHLVLWKRSQCC